MFPTFVQHTWSATKPENIALGIQEAQDIAGAVPAPPFSTTIGRLMELLEPLPEDEINGPTQHAFKNAVTLVAEAENILGHTSLKGSASLDSHGGIRVTWAVGDRQLRLICPSVAEESMYLYKEDGDISVILEPVTAALLSDCLSWLSNREQFTRTASASFDSV